jgi:hypothetical protein
VKNGVVNYPKTDAVEYILKLRKNMEKMEKKKVVGIFWLPALFASLFFIYCFIV